MNALQQHIARALEQHYGIKDADTELTPTKKNFRGDLTWKSFAPAKKAGIAPPRMAQTVGEYLRANAPEVEDFNVAGGFLNIVLADAYFTDFVRRNYKDDHFGLRRPDPVAPKLMVEYSSPNTNKPLHLGHIRNNLLGYSIAEIYKATGKPVIKTQIINDRGIHICKSMLAWQKFGRGETPETSGMKGDHLVGKYYVIYNEMYNKELDRLKKSSEYLYKLYSNNNEAIKNIFNFYSFILEKNFKDNKSLTEENLAPLLSIVITYYIEYNIIKNIDSYLSEIKINNTNDIKEFSNQINNAITELTFNESENFIKFTSQKIKNNEIKNLYFGYKKIIEIIELKSKNSIHEDKKDVNKISNKYIIDYIKFFDETKNIENSLNKFFLSDDIIQECLKKKSKYEITHCIFEKLKDRSPLINEAREMLRRWEQKDPEVMKLWKMMNSWVLDGFKETYGNLGVDFDVEYFESDTYLLGKKIVEKGLEKGIFYPKPDDSIWVKLSDEGLDEKLLLRADGTSVYITQDLGTAVKRFSEFDIDTLIYVVGNEQDYHFKVLFAILKKLGYDWADRLYHLSYGMVELPDGKMKSREGTVVDADDLMAEMTETARRISEELGKTEGLPQEEKEKLYRIIGLAALKYHLLKVDPRKTILFNPEKSIDFNGNTGPFLQYAYVRIRSILRKAGIDEYAFENLKPNEKERLLVRQLERFPQIIAGAAAERNPATLANYLYETARTFNSFYQAHSILQAETPQQKHFRLALAALTATVIRNGLKLLGIEVPERM